MSQRRNMSGTRCRLAGLILCAMVLGSSAGGAQVGDTAMVLNRQGLWRDASVIARHLLDSTGISRRDRCGLLLSEAYAEIQLKRNLPGGAAYELAKTECSAQAHDAEV